MFSDKMYKKQENRFKKHRDIRFVCATERAKNKVIYPILLFHFSLKTIKTSFSILNKNCKIP